MTTKTSRWLAILFACMAVLLWIALGDSRQTPSDTPKTVTPLPPPTYEVQTWQPLAKKAKPFADDSLLATLGNTATKEAGLDFIGNTANVYRYHTRATPPLYVVESDDFFEVSWYFANADDKDDDKILSQNYAKTAHALSSQLIGDQATPLFGAMLTEQLPTKPAGVANAKCQHKLCQIVFEKAAF